MLICLLDRKFGLFEWIFLLGFSFFEFSGRHLQKWPVFERVLQNSPSRFPVLAQSARTKSNTPGRRANAQRSRPEREKASAENIQCAAANALDGGMEEFRHWSRERTSETTSCHFRHPQESSTETVDYHMRKPPQIHCRQRTGFYHWTHKWNVQLQQWHGLISSKFTEGIKGMFWLAWTLCSFPFVKLRTFVKVWRNRPAGVKFLSLQNRRQVAHVTSAFVVFGMAADLGANLSRNSSVCHKASQKISLLPAGAKKKDNQSAIALLLKDSWRSEEKTHSRHVLSLKLNFTVYSIVREWSLRCKNKSVFVNLFHSTWTGTHVQRGSQKLLWESQFLSGRVK